MWFEVNDFRGNLRLRREAVASSGLVVQIISEDSTRPDLKWRMLIIIDFILALTYVLDINMDLIGCQPKFVFVLIWLNSLDWLWICVFFSPLVRVESEILRNFHSRVHVERAAYKSPHRQGQLINEVATDRSVRVSWPCSWKLDTICLQLWYWLSCRLFFLCQVYKLLCYESSLTHRGFYSITGVCLQAHEHENCVFGRKIREKGWKVNHFWSTCQRNASLSDISLCGTHQVETCNRRHSRCNCAQDKHVSLRNKGEESESHEGRRNRHLYIKCYPEMRDPLFDVRLYTLYYLIVHSMDSNGQPFADQVISNSDRLSTLFTQQWHTFLFLVTCKPHFYFVSPHTGFTRKLFSFLYQNFLSSATISRHLACLFTSCVIIVSSSVPSDSICSF